MNIGNASKRYIFSGDTLKTILYGALGGMSFGVYNNFITNKMMELNNEKQDLLHRYVMNKHQTDVDELKEQINKLNNISEKMSKSVKY
jgi:hypothetical protein